MEQTIKVLFIFMSIMALNGQAEVTLQWIDIPQDNRDLRPLTWGKGVRADLSDDRSETLHVVQLVPIPGETPARFEVKAPQFTTFKDDTISRYLELYEEGLVMTNKEGDVFVARKENNTITFKPITAEEKAALVEAYKKSGIDITLPYTHAPKADALKTFFALRRDTFFPAAGKYARALEKTKRNLIAEKEQKATTPERKQKIDEDIVKLDEEIKRLNFIKAETSAQYSLVTFHNITYNFEKGDARLGQPRPGLKAAGELLKTLAEPDTRRALQELRHDRRFITPLE